MRLKDVKSTLGFLRKAYRAELTSEDIMERSGLGDRFSHVWDAIFDYGAPSFDYESFTDFINDEDTIERAIHEHIGNYNDSEVWKWMQETSNWDSYVENYVNEMGAPMPGDFDIWQILGNGYWFFKQEELNDLWQQLRDEDLIEQIFGGGGDEG
jgi:hypothetical protein